MVISVSRFTNCTSFLRHSVGGFALGSGVSSYPKVREITRRMTSVQNTVGSCQTSRWFRGSFPLKRKREGSTWEKGGRRLRRKDG